MERSEGQEDHVCSSSHYYHLLHLFGIATLILNGQNNLSPIM